MVFPSRLKHQYASLLKDTELSYRTLTLYPAEELAAPLRGCLSVCSLRSSDVEGWTFPTFEALSYAWGDGKHTGAIELHDGSYIPIASNLESFLRHRRHKEEHVALWIDAICINQDDNEERSAQVQVMGKIYCLARTLSIWLGPPSDDSVLAMESLRIISFQTVFTKLSCSVEEATAIESLLGRSWWSRAWIVQELALGGLGSKYNTATVRCGSQTLLWSNFILACARMHTNGFNMRQTFPSVTNVLRLDALATRDLQEFFGLGECYAFRLLEHLSEYRDCKATDPRDKIYAMLGLWADTLGIVPDAYGHWAGLESKPAPAVDYNQTKERVHFDFTRWMLDSTQSLRFLHHCQHIPGSSAAQARELAFPSWVPDWSQSFVGSTLPILKPAKAVAPPWWSLPIRHGGEGSPGWTYLRDDQASRKTRAEQILRPTPSTLHYVPEWFVDMIDPDGNNGCEGLLKELQSRSDVFFVFADESSRALEDDSEDSLAAISRIQDHSERTLQKEVLSQYLTSGSVAQSVYRASSDTVSQWRIDGNTLLVQGLCCDTIEEVYDAFPEHIEHDWMSSTFLMVQIGKCKQGVTKRSPKQDRHVSEYARLKAFWETLSAGRRNLDGTKFESWLPIVPEDWTWATPSLSVLESGRLEAAEIRSLIDQFAKDQLTHMDTEGSTQTVEGFDEYLAQDDYLLDGRWSPTDRLRYQRSFEDLGKQWRAQPYDLYHRPFCLPYVVPDPFWNSRRTHDRVALQASRESRHRTFIESLEAPTRDMRRAFRRFMTQKIRQQPAREPQGLTDTDFIKFALGRRFFISKAGHFGLAPPGAEEGDHVAVLFGADTPFILKDVNDRYQVIGDSYVHEFMDGEVIDQWRRGTVQAQAIALI